MGALKGEENQLKVVDAWERRSQLERQQAHRRELVGEELWEQEVRISTLTKLKQQLVDQRRHRNVTKGAKERVSKDQHAKAFEPGPGSYEISSTVATKEGPTISTSDPKLCLIEGSIDEQMKRSTAIPPPGIYDPRVLPKGTKTFNTDKPMRIGERNATLFHASIVKATKDNPGPGSYNLQNDKRNLSTRGPAMRQSFFGTSINSERDVGIRSLRRIDREIPGPGEYAVDEYTRSQRLTKAASLEKNAMQMLL